MKHIEWWTGQFAGHTVRLQQRVLPPYTWQALRVWAAWRDNGYYGIVIQNGLYGWSFANPAKDQQTTIAVGMPFSADEMSLEGYSPTVERGSGGVLRYVTKVRPAKPKCDHPECLWLKSVLANTIIPAFKRRGDRLTTDTLYARAFSHPMRVERNYSITRGDIEWVMRQLNMERSNFGAEWRPKHQRRK